MKEKMTNVIQIKKKSDLIEFTRKVPESATILELASIRPVKVFDLECIQTGAHMVMAHFDDDGWHHLYHDGTGAHTAHLFFWLIAWQDDKSPEDVALEFFQGKLILCD